MVSVNGFATEWKEATEFAYSGEESAGYAAHGRWLETHALTVGTGRVGTDVPGRERVETVCEAVGVGLTSLNGGGGGDKSSDGVSELHGGLLSDGDRKGLVRRARKQGVTGGKERRGHEARMVKGEAWRTRVESERPFCGTDGVL